MSEGIIITDHPRLDGLFEQGKAMLGNDYAAYRNHCWRVFNSAAIMTNAENDDLEKLAIAAYFHDIGIWSDQTFDYLQPSAARAREYLSEQGLDDWADEVSAMITEHHKVSATRGQGRLVEAFRRADWIDVTLGVLRFGVAKDILQQLQAKFPNEGFHKRLVALTLQRMRQKPLSPLPMFKW
ncbi:MAG: HD domain-containing protein [Salinisphaeraceae bacterium]|nr:HD domain-containing protein [Salinisphaeraceae bacterium]